jgi:hypothetical protein
MPMAIMENDEKNKAIRLAAMAPANASNRGSGGMAPDKSPSGSSSISFVEDPQFSQVILSTSLATNSPS